MICGSGALSQGGRKMNIGFIADSNRKDLIENFCVAYKSILAKHNLYATEMTGRRRISGFIAHLSGSNSVWDYLSGQNW